MDDDAAAAWLEFTAGERVFLTASCSIGRSPENRVVIPSDAVSRRHAILRREDSGEWTLLDMGSSNGTYVNGLPVSQRVTLRDGAVVEIGPQKFTFRLPGAEPLEMPPAGETVECWLLSFAATLIGARERTDAHLAKTFENWNMRCQRIVKKFRGFTMRGADDSFLAFWPARGVDRRAETVASTLRSLRAVQKASEEFRFALHFGAVTLRPGENGEFKPQGEATIYAFQLDRLARLVGRPTLITQAAARALSEVIELRPLTERELPGYRGSQAFFTTVE